MISVVSIVLTFVYSHDLCYHLSVDIYHSVDIDITAMVYGAPLIRNKDALAVSSETHLAPAECCRLMLHYALAVDRIVRPSPT